MLKYQQTPLFQILSTKIAINHTLQPSTSGTKNFGSASFAWKDINAKGSLYIRGNRILNIDDFKQNTFLGLGAGMANTEDGFSNTASGAYALYFNNTGTANTANGNQALS